MPGLDKLGCWVPHIYELTYIPRNQRQLFWAQREGMLMDCEDIFPSWLIYPVCCLGDQGVERLSNGGDLELKMGGKHQFSQVTSKQVFIIRHHCAWDIPGWTPPWPLSCPRATTFDRLVIILCFTAHWLKQTASIPPWLCPYKHRCKETVPKFNNKNLSIGDGWNSSYKVLFLPKKKLLRKAMIWLLYEDMIRMCVCRATIFYSWELKAEKGTQFLK